MAQRVLMVAHPGALGMELLGARDILEVANWSSTLDGRERPYDIGLAAVDGQPVRLWGGLEVGPALDLSAIREAVHTLIVVGGPLADNATDIPELVAGIRRLAQSASRVVGICTGAFLLGAAGLLDGRRCTTHWAWGKDLATRYPLAKVDTNSIFIRDGGVWTSAGVTAGFDMLLAMLKDDLGSAASRRVSQRLVLYMNRSGGQSQFDHEDPPLARHDPIRKSQQYIADHPTENLSLGELATRANMSPRHFARVFRADLGVSPGRYVETTRVDAARKLLEETSASTESIAVAAGFGNYRSMHRSFTLTIGVAPAEYRRRFGAIDPEIMEHLISP